MDKGLGSLLHFGVHIKLQEAHIHQALSRHSNAKGTALGSKAKDQCLVVEKI